MFGFRNKLIINCGFEFTLQLNCIKFFFLIFKLVLRDSRVVLLLILKWWKSSVIATDVYLLVMIVQF